MTWHLQDRVALVAGGTRGAGRGIAVELGYSGATLRSEAVLDVFGVTEDNWRDAVSEDKHGEVGHFGASETPRYIGRAVAALATDPDVSRHHGRALTTGQLARKNPASRPTSKSSSRARARSSRSSPTR